MGWMNPVLYFRKCMVATARWLLDHREVVIRSSLLWGQLHDARAVSPDEFRCAPVVNAWMLALRVGEDERAFWDDPTPARGRRMR